MAEADKDSAINIGHSSTMEKYSFCVIFKILNNALELGKQQIEVN